VLATVFRRRKYSISSCIALFSGFILVCRAHRASRRQRDYYESAGSNEDEDDEDEGDDDDDDNNHHFVKKDKNKALSVVVGPWIDWEKLEQDNGSPNNHHHPLRHICFALVSRVIQEEIAVYIFEGYYSDILY
jgi:hypothetical protein